ncbi:hypothetical protein MRX96_002920 [Rhipicephalus microplus]
MWLRSHRLQHLYRHSCGPLRHQEEHPLCHLRSKQPSPHLISNTLPVLRNQTMTVRVIQFWYWRDEEQYHAENIPLSYCTDVVFGTRTLYNNYTPEAKGSESSYRLQRMPITILQIGGKLRHRVCTSTGYTRGDNCGGPNDTDNMISFIHNLRALNLSVILAIPPEPAVVSSYDLPRAMPLVTYLVVKTHTLRLSGAVYCSGSRRYAGPHLLNRSATYCHGSSATSSPTLYRWPRSQDPWNCRTRMRKAYDDGMGDVPIFVYDIDLDDFKGSCPTRVMSPLIRTLAITAYKT